MAPRLLLWHLASAPRLCVNLHLSHLIPPFDDPVYHVISLGSEAVREKGNDDVDAYLYRSRREKGVKKEDEMLPHWVW
jgi:hypothetical protein